MFYPIKQSKISDTVDRKLHKKKRAPNALFLEDQQIFCIFAW